MTVELVSNGGAFGGKEDMSNQAQASLAAWLLDRPVKCTLSREESLRMHAKRHPIHFEYGAGCDAEGHLTALAGPRHRRLGRVRQRRHEGARTRRRPRRAAPYRWQALDIETIAVRTNNLVCGAFRGFGANQAQFALEGVLDRLAEQVGISGWEIRKRNVIRPGDEWGPGQIMDDGAGGAEACLDEIKDAYDAAVADGKAVGLGLGLKNSGLGNGFREVSRAVVHFHPDADGEPGRVEVRHGWTEMGQGVHTVALQVAAEELAIDPNRIDVIVDTTRQLGFGQTTGSRGTLMTAGSVSEACAAALAAGCAPGVDYEGEYLVDWTQKLGDPNVANPTIHSCFSFATQMVVIDRETRRHRQGRRRARRRQGRQPDARRGPDRGQRPHGPRLRAERGLPDRSRDRLPDQHDAALARHPAGQGRAGDGGARSSRCPNRARRSASRASARSASSRRRPPSPPRSTTSTAVAHHPPHAPRRLRVTRTGPIHVCVEDFAAPVADPDANEIGANDGRGRTAVSVGWPAGVAGWSPRR